VGDLHQLIIHRRRQVIERQSVRPDQNIVIQGAVFYGDVAAQQSNGRAAGTAFETDDNFSPASTRARRQPSNYGRTVVMRCFASLLLGAHLVQAFRCAEADKGLSRCPVSVLLIVSLRSD
jgi:hypothetical protein